jgi:SurA-like protein
VGGLAALVIAGCGNAFVPPAAVVDGRRITQSDLELELAALLTSPQFAEQVKGPGGEAARKDLTRRLLSFLIETEVILEYARAHHIRATPQEVDGQLQQVIQQAGGRDRLDAELRRRGLSIDRVRLNLERQIVAQKVQAAVQGQDPNAQDAFTGWLQRRLQQADIAVNPRFGTFDPRDASITPITTISG